MENRQKKIAALESDALKQFRAAMQSRTPSDFIEKTRAALALQRQASRYYKKAGLSQQGKALRSFATEAYLEFWLSKVPSRKTKLLEQAWNVAKKSLKKFNASKQYPEFAETYHRFSPALGLSIESDGNLQSRRRKLKEGIDTGRQTLRLVEPIENEKELAKTMAKISFFLDSFGEESRNQKQRDEYEREAGELWQEALRICREGAVQEISHPLAGFQGIRDPDKGRRLALEGLRIVRPTRDCFAIGRLMDVLAKWTSYAAISSASSESPARAKKLHTEALHYAEEAARHYEIINQFSPIAGTMWAHSPYSDYFWNLARHENDRTSRRLMLEKSVRSSSELIRVAKKTGNPRVIIYAFHTTMKAESNLSQYETDKSRKKNLLRRAISRGVSASQIVQQINAPRSWNRAVTLWTVAEARFRLAELEENQDVQSRLLQRSSLEMKECLNITTAFIRALKPPVQPLYYDQIGNYQRAYGDLLLRLTSLIHKDEYLRNAPRHYKSAAEYYRRIPRYDRMAQSYWRAAGAYDQLRKHSLASESFRLASKAYKKLGKRVPALAAHSLDYSRYLMAWNKIELARDSHLRAAYASAADSYNEAARLLKSAQKWSFLASHFSAWAKLEAGENCSIHGLRQQAVGAFLEAEKLFSESKISLGESITSTDQLDERSVARALADAPGAEYARARAILDEAIEAQSQGDYEASVEKFGHASEKLRDISNRFASGRDGRETTFLSILCDAWRSTTKAESDNSIKHLNEALILFRRAAEVSPSPTATKLAEGHVAFCNGLIASRKFAETLDQSSCIEASRQLDLASTYYLESGFTTASDHSTGRKLLLEGIAKMREASQENDHEKRTILFRMANALLEESAIAFQKARQPRKQEQARALSEKAKAESKVASDLTEILNTTLDPSTNVAFNVLAQGGERAGGLERFERGDVETRLATYTTHSGKNAEVTIEITNIGKEPIRILRLENLVPDGVELRGVSDGWRVNGRSITANHKQLGTLQTETVAITIGPKQEGMLRISPTIIYTDASGVESERTMKPRTFPTSQIMEYLAKAFLQDYSSKRLALPNSGWRTMMQTVRDLRIPRSHVYGELRHGRAFGKQLDALLKSSQVECRIFPGERGRGGEITKLRVALENENVRKYVEDMSPFSTGLHASTATALSNSS